MDPNLLTAGLRVSIRSQKQALIDAHGIGTDFPPTLITLCKGMLIGAYRLGRYHNDPESVAVVHSALALSQADTAVFISEHYVAPGDTKDGWLGQRFADGDADVSEAVALTVVDRQAVLVRFEPYHYEGRQVVWHPVDNPSPTLARRLGEVAVHHAVPAFDAQNKRAGPPALGPGSRLHLLGTERLDDDTALVAMALTQGCPCGSGRAMNQCCAQRN